MLALILGGLLLGAACARMKGPPRAPAMTATATADATSASPDTTRMIAGVGATLAATARPPTETPSPSPSPTPRPLEVHFIDVGQGDAMLLRTPSGRAALVDGGEAGSGVLAYLQAQGVRQLDLLVATHAHPDHIGGLVDVLQAMPVGRIVANGQPCPAPIYERFLHMVSVAPAPYAVARRGDRLPLGGMELQVLHPESAMGDVINNQCLVLRLRYGQVSFLFAADVEEGAEASLLASGQELKATVLKVAHHGSDTSSTVPFLAAVSPEVAVYSCAAGNAFGHPHAAVLSALARAGARIFGTDVSGTVVVATDGRSYTVTTREWAARPEGATALVPALPLAPARLLWPLCQVARRHPRSQRPSKPGRRHGISALAIQP